MYEMTMENAQMQNIEKYKTGTPNIEPGISKINNTGIFNTTSSPIPRITNFCS